MLTRASLPERILLSPAFSIALSLCAAAVMALWGDVETWIAIPLSVALGAVASVRVRARSLFKGPTFTVLSTFMLLQAAAPQTLSGCLFAIFAFVTVLVLFSFFQQPGVTRLFYFLFLVNGTIAFFCPSWIMWAVTMLGIMIVTREFSLRGLVAAILGVITPFIIIPFWSAIFSANPFATLEHLFKPYLIPVFTLPDNLPPDAFIFSAIACIILSLLTFLTAYGYPFQIRLLNMAMFVISACAIICPLITVEGYNLWLPLLNLCVAYHTAHFIASRRRKWIFAASIWLIIIAFIVKQLCG